MAINIKSLIIAFIGIVIGLALFPAVRNTTDTAYESSLSRTYIYWLNITGDNATYVNGSTTSPITGYQLISLIPTIYILMIFGGAIGYIYFTSRD